MSAFASLFLFAILSVSVCVDAAPRFIIREAPTTLSISTRLNLAKGTKLADIDRARVKAAKQHALQRSKGKSSSTQTVSVVDAGTIYLATVGVGYPPNNYSLIVDTGSSNTWVGADKPYVKTQTSIPTGEGVNATYGSGSFIGKEFLDQVTLGPNLVIKKQSIGVATSSRGFNGTDGILGIGPADLTTGTLIGHNQTEIPTVTDNLFAQGKIPSDSLAISFEPTTALGVTNGEITFGRTDSTKFTGKIHYTPITTTSPSSFFWGIDQSITYGTHTPLLSLTSGIVDTGTTLLLIASDALATYQSLTGAVMDENTGLLSVTPKQFSKLQSLFFKIHGVEYEFTRNAQLLPRELNVLAGGKKTDLLLIVGDIGTPSGQGLDFINGFSFLQRFYSVFDTANARVGLATTPFTNATTN